MLLRHGLLIAVVSLGVVAGCGPGPSSGDPDGGGATGGGGSAPPVGGNSGGGSATGGGDPQGGGSGLDAGTDGGATLRTLTNYRTCQSTGDCPTGLGVCITSVSLNRRDSQGRTSIPISEIFSGLQSGQGVCSLDCTTTPEVCTSLSLQGLGTPDPRPHVCQVVTTGASPYPFPQPAPSYPVTVSLSELALGIPFGAICRPPFALSPAIIDGFCEACASTTDCEGGLCWDFKQGAEASETGGVCLAPCASGDECPWGFECASLGGQGVCRPLLDTCTACSDRDRDGRGAGRCGTLGAPVTPHDCDDSNADAYYDPANPAHAFPTFCGAQDFNCNGLSDAVEEIGSESFGVSHCTSCGDPCVGTVTDGSLRCSVGSDCQVVSDAGVYVCVAPPPDVSATCHVVCTPGFVDCNGDPADGCEERADDVSRNYFRDDDGDGYGHGTPGDTAGWFYECVSGTAPAGWVTNNVDCDDQHATVFGAVLGADGGVVLPAHEERCDSLDNDCDGFIDDADPGLTLTPTGCTVDGGVGLCAVGHWACGGLPDGGGAEQCVGAQPGSVAEVCYFADGGLTDFDEDCDGLKDEGVDSAAPADAKLWHRDSDGDTFGTNDGGVVRQCAAPSGYVASATDCNDDNQAIKPGAVEVCDGVDNNCDGLKDDDVGSGVVGARTWYVDADGDDAGVVANAIARCVRPSGYADPAAGVDCADNDNQRSPLLKEQCGDSKDNNCNGQVDEPGTVASPSIGAYPFYPDSDGDTYGRSTAALVAACSSGAAVAPSGYSTNHTDCNDSNNLINPSRAELANSTDDNCNGTIDDGFPTCTGSCNYTWAGTSTGNFQGDNISGGFDTWHEGDCGSGGVLVGFYVVTGTGGLAYIDTLWPICKTAWFQAYTSSTPYTYGLSEGASWNLTNDSSNHGYGNQSPTGATNTISCGSGQFVTGINAEWFAGSQLTKLGLSCAGGSVPGLPGTPGSTLSLTIGSGSNQPSVGGTSGNRTGTSSCNGSAAVGWQIASHDVGGGAVQGIALKCSTLAFPLH